MGITERVDAMVVRAANPSGSVTAQLSGLGDIEISFAPGFYQRADAHEMETQLAQVAKLLWAARTRAYRAILDDEYEGGIIIDAPPQDSRDEKFYDQRDRLVAEGKSSDGRVHVSVRGMRDWTVQLVPRTLDELREVELIAAVGQAAQELIRDQTNKMRELKVSIYDPDALK